MRGVRLLTGTSGFSYPQWRGSFYPAELADDAMLAHYAGKLPAVEINNTFYRMPKAHVVAGWAAAVPASFTFVIKASQRISHKGKLGPDAIDSMQYLWKMCEPLGAQLGAVLVQLPPWIAADAGVLREFLAAAVPREHKVAFELPHASWQTPQIEQLVVDHGAAIVIADRADGSARWPALGSWAYVRLRKDAYAPAMLDDWYAKLAAARLDTACVFFKHEDTAAGAELAMSFVQRGSVAP
jgi:uncharacterized protein YecE (DUF72 family)